MQLSKENITRLKLVLNAAAIQLTESGNHDNYLRDAIAHLGVIAFAPNPGKLETLLVDAREEARESLSKHFTPEEYPVIRMIPGKIIG